MESKVEETPKKLEDIEPKMRLIGTVVKTTLAGVIVDIGINVPGVVHISQLRKEPVNRVEDVVEIGQEVVVWVRRVFPKKQRIELTMIEPLPLEWREIKEGMKLKGTITRLEKYGAFVEVGAERPGLIHISELTHGYVRTPSEVVQEGDEIEAKVLKVNRRKKQIKLSLKALSEEPSKVVKKVQKEEKQSERDKPVPTAMEIALREAMERSQKEDEVEVKKPGRKSSPKSEELGNILSRTLDHKVKTGSKD
ncbi:MAG: S1 RNA-binding domain-containing protein [Anaerolineales bacterium]|jgi:predicted RNA-binding protein with RPS1 domain